MGAGDARRAARLCRSSARRLPAVSGTITAILAKALAGRTLAEAEIVRLFRARGHEFAAVCTAADELRQAVNGNAVSYVVTRNINYTNICYFKCQFCAFSKGKMSENLRGRPYDLALEEIAERMRGAWARGATEVCMQGGIHPSYTGAKYLRDLRRRETAPCPTFTSMLFRRWKCIKAPKRWAFRSRSF